MSSIKRTKIAAMLLLIMLAASVIKAQGLTVTSPEYVSGRTVPEGFIPWLSYELSVSSLPKVGEVFDVTFKIRSANDLDGSRFGPDYMVTFTSNAATILTGKEYKFSGFMKRGEVKQFKAKMVINKPSPTVSINGIISAESWFFPQGISLVIFLINKKSGQYGTKEEYEGKLPVEYRYDPIDGSFTCSPSQNPAPVEENRKIIKMMKQLEPALSDSEALLLHSDQYQVGHPKGIPTWDKATQTWNEQEIFEYYLKDNWFKALRAGTREEWIKKEKQKIADTWKERRFNFFRDNYSSNNNYLDDNSPFSKKITAYL